VAIVGGTSDRLYKYTNICLDYADLQQLIQDNPTSTVRVRFTVLHGDVVIDECFVAAPATLGTVLCLRDTVTISAQHPIVIDSDTVQLISDQYPGVSAADLDDLRDALIKLLTVGLDGQFISFPTDGLVWRLFAEFGLHYTLAISAPNPGSETLGGYGCVLVSNLFSVLVGNLPSECGYPPPACNPGLSVSLDQSTTVNAITFPCLCALPPISTISESILKKTSKLRW
jgi:hypothetical protein